MGVSLYDNHPPRIADMVEAIGGDQVQVTALCGPGVDPHLYKASQSDISQFSRSNVIFYNGLNLEGRMEDIFESMRTMGKTTVAVAESVDRSRLLEPEGIRDIMIHISGWMSVYGCRPFLQCWKRWRT